MYDMESQMALLAAKAAAPSMPATVRAHSRHTNALSPFKSVQATSNDLQRKPPARRPALPIPRKWSAHVFILSTLWHSRPRGLRSICLRGTECGA